MQKEREKIWKRKKKGSLLSYQNFTPMNTLRKLLAIVVVTVVTATIGITLKACGSTWNIEGNTSNIFVVKKDTVMNIKAGTKIIQNDTTKNEIR